MMNTNIPQAIAQEWASKVDEVLSSEGLFRDTCLSSSSLIEWRLPFYASEQEARLSLSAQSVAGQPLTVALSWQLRALNPDARNTAGHCRASWPLDTCDVADLPAAVSAALKRTAPSALASWVLSTYEPGRAKELAKSLTPSRDLCDA
jgi:hypothetical protein